jgi:tetratricopeptide (TPR) repeat protein
MEPTSEQYLADLASELTAAGETKKAAQLLDRAKARFPSSGRIRFAEGIWYQLTERKSEALAAFKQAADFSWEWEAPHLAQANLLLQTGSIAESQDISEQTATLFPNSPWPHWLKGLAVLKNQGGALSQSPEEIKQSVRLAAGRQEALPILLLSSLKYQDCDTAQVVWGTMIKSGWTPEIDPKNWCGSEKDSASAKFSLPANMGNPSSNLRWLIDLAQSTFH